MSGRCSQNCIGLGVLVLSATRSGLPVAVLKPVGVGAADKLVLGGAPAARELPDGLRPGRCCFHHLELVFGCCLSDAGARR